MNNPPPSRSKKNRRRPREEMVLGRHLREPRLTQRPNRCNVFSRTWTVRGLYGRQRARFRLDFAIGRPAIVESARTNVKSSQGRRISRGRHPSGEFERRAAVGPTAVGPSAPVVFEASWNTKRDETRRFIRPLAIVVADKNRNTNTDTIPMENTHKRRRDERPAPSFARP